METRDLPTIKQLSREICVWARPQASGRVQPRNRRLPSVRKEINRAGSSFFHSVKLSWQTLFYSYVQIHPNSTL